MKSFRMDNEEFMNKANKLVGYMEGLKFDTPGIMAMSDYLLEVTIRSIDELAGGFL